jgi:desulfoferrodoxin (superoxide reductase-like protein)
MECSASPRSPSERGGAARAFRGGGDVHASSRPETSREPESRDYRDPDRTPAAAAAGRAACVCAPVSVSRVPHVLQTEHHYQL